MSRRAFQSQVLLYAVIGGASFVTAWNGPIDYHFFGGLIGAIAIAVKAKYSLGKPADVAATTVNQGANQ